MLQQHANVQRDLNRAATISIGLLKAQANAALESHQGQMAQMDAGNRRA